MKVAELTVSRLSDVALLTVELAILDEERKGSRRRMQEFEVERGKSAAEIERLDKGIEDLKIGMPFNTLLTVELKQEKKKVGMELRNQHDEGNSLWRRLRENNADMEGFKKGMEDLSIGISCMTLLILELQQEMAKVGIELRKQRDEGNRLRIRLSKMDDGNLNVTLLI
jgi:chromosome segregation ATPase